MHFSFLFSSLYLSSCVNVALCPVLCAGLRRFYVCCMLLRGVASWRGVGLSCNCLLWYCTVVEMWLIYWCLFRETCSSFAFCDIHRRHLHSVVKCCIVAYYVNYGNLMCSCCGKIISCVGFYVERRHSSLENNTCVNYYLVVLSL